MTRTSNASNADLSAGERSVSFLQWVAFPFSPFSPGPDSFWGIILLSQVWNQSDFIFGRATMKKINLILLTAMLSCPTAYAGMNDTPWYLGIIGAFVDAGAGVTDDAFNGGVELGYKFNQYVSAEGQLTTTLIDGETQGGVDWDVDTLSVYAAFRSDTKVKLKGKIGISSIDTGRADDTELSAGIGVGFWALGGLTEIEYTVLSDDLDLEFLSFGVKFFY